MVVYVASSETLVGWKRWQRCWELAHNLSHSSLQWNGWQITEQPLRLKHPLIPRRCSMSKFTYATSRDDFPTYASLQDGEGTDCAPFIKLPPLWVIHYAWVINYAVDIWVLKLMRVVINSSKHNMFIRLGFTCYLPRLSACITYTSRIYETLVAYPIYYDRKVDCILLKAAAFKWHHITMRWNKMPA